MEIRKSPVDWTQLRLARFLATRAATPVLLVGTLALAAGGAVATTPTTTDQSSRAVAQTTLAPLFVPVICHQGRQGTIVCRIPANEVAVYAVAYACRQDQRRDGLYVCRFMSN
jgi:hypothetical protein